MDSTVEEKELLEESFNDLQNINNRVYYWVSYEDCSYLRNVKEIEISGFDPDNKDWIIRLRNNNCEKWAGNIVAELNIAYVVQELFPINILPLESHIHTLFITNLTSLKQAKREIEQQLKYSLIKMIKNIKYVDTRKEKILNLDI